MAIQTPREEIGSMLVGLTVFMMLFIIFSIMVPPIFIWLIPLRFVVSLVVSAMLSWLIVIMIEETGRRNL